MEELGFGSLWLQVILVTVATFFASALLWTTMPWHEKEFGVLPDEDAVRRVLAEQGVTQGQWRIPYSQDPKEWKGPEFQKRFESGPVGILQFEKPGPMGFGARLGKTFLLYLFIAFFTAYVLRQAIEAGDTYMRVFQLAGSVSLGAHAFGHVQDAIWFGKSWKRVLLQLVDSMIYAIITAGIFASMWPWA